jgi:hypothetical protein
LKRKVIQQKYSLLVSHGNEIVKNTKQNETKVSETKEDKNTYLEAKRNMVRK